MIYLQQRANQRKMNKPMNKKRQKGSKPVIDEIEVAGKNLRDEALKYMKVSYNTFKGANK